MEEKMAYKSKAPYSEITKKELRKLRKTGDPLLILKMEGKFYSAKVDKDFSLLHSIYRKNECTKRCYCKETSCFDLLDRRTYMEDYDWVITAFETINTVKEELIVVECGLKWKEKGEKVRTLYDELELER